MTSSVWKMAIRRLQQVEMHPPAMYGTTVGYLDLAVPNIELSSDYKPGEPIYSETRDEILDCLKTIGCAKIREWDQVNREDGVPPTVIRLGVTHIQTLMNVGIKHPVLNTLSPHLATLDMYLNTPAARN